MTTNAGSPTTARGGRAVVCAVAIAATLLARCFADTPDAGDAWIDGGFDAAGPLPTPGDDNVVYRLVHRLIPGPGGRGIPPADITSPGPDSACFTNSAFTLPKGRSYVENAPCTVGLAGPGVPQQWSWPFLLRTGLTDDCEFRIFSQGPTVDGPVRDSPTIAGFQPLGFELKVHLWGEPDRLYCPAVGLRTSLTTNLASRKFQVGNQPGISLLFDHHLPDDWLLEWNAGYFGTNLPTYPNAELPFFPNSVSLPFLGVQWSLQKKLTDRLTLFYQGFYTSASRPFYPAGLVSGFGGELAVSQRLMVYATTNWSLEPYGSPAGGWAGFAYAY